MIVGGDEMKIMAVTDNKHSFERLSSILLEIHPYVDYVQIREKAKSPKEIYLLGERLLKEGIPARKIIINDRLDVAALLSLTHVHLPGNGLPIQPVKNIYPTLSIGVSVHSQQEAIIAENVRADYVIYGHCYPTDSKKGKIPIALSSITGIKRDLTIPLYAIGGINEERVGQLASLGVDGVAIMSAIFSASQPLRAVQRIRERCEECGNQKI